MTIDEIVEYTEYQTEKLNEYLTKRIIERIMAVYDQETGVQMIPATIRDIVKMLSTGKTLKEIEKDIEKKLPGMEKEIRKAFEYAGNEIEREQDGFLKNVIEDSAIAYHAVRTGPYVKADQLYLTETEKALLESACRRTQGTFRNYTATTAKSTQTALIDAMDKAYNKVVHGVSLHTATAEAIEEYAKVGTMVDFGSGVRQRLETVVTRAVRTGLAQASGDITLARCNELDVDQVLVTSHIGARYTDKHEPANHMWWQGKVYDWYKPGQKKATDSVGQELHKVAAQIQHDPNESAGDFIEITGYGTGEGLCGWNCRHTFTPFFKGININNQKQFDDAENKKRYDLEQKQRAMERKLRDMNRQYEGLNHAYNIAPDGPLKDALKVKKQDAHKKYIDSVKSYNEWSKNNGLRPKQERLRIAKNAVEPKPQKHLKVTDEYLNNKTPGVGKVEFDPNLNTQNSADEVKFANWIHDNLGGDIKVLEVKVGSDGNKISTPDYIWNNKAWDLKTISSAKAADNAIRKGVKQINMPGYNPGGIILNCGDNNIDNIDLISRIEDRMKKNIDPKKAIDVMIIKNNKLDKVLRY